LQQAPFLPAREADYTLRYRNTQFKCARREPDLIQKVCDISGSYRAEALATKTNRREPAGTFDQQTFIDVAEDRDCARGAFIVIGGSMSAADSGGAGWAHEGALQ
jgi:hypothetical protein